ncbi:hypothetical protein [Sulfurospirillum cavolei]|uniref:hypothetical protein n=1 Tax=Sulfurospirillum cavolei TaxID=366522 RepID=UPI000764A872|nr:hypothetical protein [Sulfurospirillum cavolei]
MQDFINKTFKGLNTAYYVRHFIFGIVIAIVFVSALSNGFKHFSFGFIFSAVLNTFLYPYARFVYESVVGYIFGNNVFFVNMILLLTLKIISMMICWTLAIFIAPLGLGYLYFYHSKNS